VCPQFVKLFDINKRNNYIITPYDSVLFRLYTIAFANDIDSKIAEEWPNFLNKFFTHIFDGKSK